MDPALLLRLLPLLVAAETPEAQDPTQGIELPLRVRESPELRRWKALVHDDEEEVSVPALSEGKLRRALVLAEQIDPEGALHALTLIKLGSLWAESSQLDKKEQEVRSSFERAVGIFERLHGREHVGVALGLHRLGSMLAFLADL